MKPTRSERARFHYAVSQGFGGTLDDYLQEKKAYRKAWGKSKEKEEGHFVFWLRCSKCGRKKFEHIGGGLCQSCYHKNRRNKDK